MFSLVTGLPSTTSAAGVSTRLFGGFAGTMPVFDSSLACLPGLRFWLPSPVRRPGKPPDADEVSRFSRVQFLDVRTAPGLRRAWWKLAMSFPPVWPSREKHSVGARDAFFEARFLARRCLCLDFTPPLATPSASFEVKMVRYSLSCPDACASLRTAAL